MLASRDRPPDWRDNAPRSWGDDFFVVRFALPAPSNDVVIPFQHDLRSGQLAAPALAGAALGLHAACAGGEAGGAVLLPPGVTEAEARALAAWLAARPELARVELDTPRGAAEPGASATRRLLAPDARGGARRIRPAAAPLLLNYRRGFRHTSGCHEGP